MNEETYHEEGVFNRCVVEHRSEEVLSQLQHHKLFEEAIAHHELLGGTTDVAVVVHDAHSSETSDVHLKSDMLSHVNVDVCLLCWISTHCLSGTEVIKALVPYFVDHFIIIII